MALTQVQEILKDEGLEYPRLSVLQANASLYTALLVQPQPRIYVSEDEIRNLEPLAAESFSVGIMQFAREKSVELLVLPEYSVPWRALENVLRAGGGPRTGHIWVLGCESISTTDVLALKQRFAPHAQVIHEPVDLANVEPTTAVYFDPLIYLFRTRTYAGAVEKLVMLVQFKTHPSGDPANIEVASMARGKCIYLFQGPHAEVRLVTFICSDVLALSPEDITECYENTLLLHIQLNDNPRAEVYNRYKRSLFGPRCNRTELICLNWAAGIEFHFAQTGSTITKKNIAGSAWHTGSDQVNTSDPWVESNHRSGLYYTRNEDEKCHVLHFAYGSAAFLIHATKVKHTAVPAAQSYRTGPKLIEVYDWDAAASLWKLKAQPFDDGFRLYCSQFGKAGSQLLAAHQGGPLTAERIVELTGGSFSPEKNWHQAEKLRTARINGDEIVRRITVTQDPASTESRDDDMSKVEALAALVGSIPFKPPLEDLKSGFEFVWSDKFPHCNLVSKGAKPTPAIIIYAGAGKRPDFLAGLYAKTSKVAGSGGLPDRFAVVYLDGVHVKLCLPATPNPINKTAVPGNNITEPEK